jgi:hypothetical protein
MDFTAHFWLGLLLFRRVASTFNNKPLIGTISCRFSQKPRCPTHGSNLLEVMNPLIDYSSRSPPLLKKRSFSEDRSLVVVNATGLDALLSEMRKSANFCINFRRQSSIGLAILALPLTCKRQFFRERSQFS